MVDVAPQKSHLDFFLRRTSIRSMEACDDPIFGNRSAMLGKEIGICSLMVIYM